MLSVIPHARQKWGALPATFGSIIPCALEPCHGHWLSLIPRRQPGLKWIDDASPRLGGAATGEVELATVFLHHPTGDVLFFQPQVVITGLVLAPREAAAGDIPAMDGRFPRDAQPFDSLRCRRVVVFFSIWLTMASGSAIFC